MNIVGKGWEPEEGVGGADNCLREHIKKILAFLLDADTKDLTPPPAPSC